MTRTWLARAVLSVLIGWGVWAGLARAIDPGYYPKTPPNATELPPGYEPVDSSPKKFPVAHCLFHGRPLGCWASFNGYTCSSLKSEIGFIFGSCRTFYSEPCLKGAPPSALPPWAGPESGYHQYPPAGVQRSAYSPDGTYPGFGLEPRSGCPCR
jgi:hypothetical protein